MRKKYDHKTAELFCLSDYRIGKKAEGIVSVKWAVEVWKEAKYDKRYRASTVRTYLRSCRMAALRFGEKVPTKGEVEIWQNELLNEGLSPQTINLYIKAVTAVAHEAALATSRDDAHRLADVMVSARRLRTGIAIPRCPTTSTIRKVLNACEDSGEKSIVRIMAIGGLRIGEALALRWGDIGDDGTVTIEHTWDMESNVMTRRKNKNGHKIKIDEKTEKEITKWAGGDIKQQNKGERIWPWSKHKIEKIKRKIKKKIEKDGEEKCANWESWHQLRHWGGSIVARMTGETQAVQAYLGDRSPTAAQCYMPALRAITTCDCNDIARELEDEQV